MAISQTITAIPEAGHRGVDVRDTFVTKQEAFQDALTATTVDELNTWAAQANSTASAVSTDEATVVAKEALMNPHYTAIDACAAITADITATAAVDAEIAALAAIASDITNVSDNISDLSNYADTYYGPKSSEPTTRNDASAMQPGDLYYDTSDALPANHHIRSYNGTVWGTAYSSSFYTRTEADALLDVKIDSDTTETGTSQIINVVKLTQAAYDALTPVATTLYVIVG